MEENGIEVDVVAGASMGAYVGALWAHGCDGGELERLSRELERRWALWSLIDPAFPPRRGFLRGIAVKKRLMRTIGESSFADLARPLRVVAANPIKDAKVLALAYLRQARIAYRAKDRSRAIIFVKRALQENPDLEEAKALLDQLR